MYKTSKEERYVALHREIQSLFCINFKYTIFINIMNKPLYNAGKTEELLDQQLYK